MPAQERPLWAIRLFKFAVAQGGVPSSPIGNLMRIATDPARWGEAHAAFNLVRRSTLALQRQRTNEEETLYRLLLVGEITAKVIYNATDTTAPFDEDSGWRVAGLFKHFLDHLNGEDSSEQAWLVLCGQQESLVE